MGYLHLNTAQTYLSDDNDNNNNSNNNVSSIYLYFHRTTRFTVTASVIYTRVFYRSCFKSAVLFMELEAGHSIECITHADHS